MLSELHIRNFAIVDSLDLEFQPGMTTLTGETGAGKSIAIDALAIALGDRAESGLLRAGCERGEVLASFDVSKNRTAKQWLKEQELDDEDDCILRRTLSESGSKAYINGRPVPLQLLKQLSEKLIDIYSQHQHQSLLVKNEQRKLLDAYAQNETVLQAVQQSFQQWRQTKDELQSLQQAADERASRMDFLQFQCEELEGLQLKENEWQELEKEHRHLANFEKIHQTISAALLNLYDDEPSLLSRLQATQTSLQAVSDFMPELNSVGEMLNSAAIQTEEAINELRSLQDDSDADPQRFQWLENRMGELMDAARKHRCEPEELLSTFSKLSEELYQLQHSEEQLDELQARLEKLQLEYFTHAKKLSQQRAQAAKKLSSEVSKLVKKLGMGSAEFQVELETLEKPQPAAHGLENINFLVCTNPGQPFKPLAKTASGGELSRLSLAIQVVTSKVAQIPSLIFDEVDVGIGGGVAEIVGELLRKLGDNRQIICITHQAQVAAQGHQHYKVAKSTQKGSTSTRIQSIEGDDRIDELARMIGGQQITATTRQHASEMLNKAQAK